LRKTEFAPTDTLKKMKERSSQSVDEWANPFFFLPEISIDLHHSCVIDYRNDNQVDIW
jgi:hypothetical protein